MKGSRVQVPFEASFILFTIYYFVYYFRTACIYGKVDAGSFNKKGEINGR